MPDSTLVAPLPYLLRGLFMGRLVRVDAVGLHVDYPGNERGPVVAMTILSEVPKTERVDVPVLLAFADNVPDVPIVLGFIAERLPADLDSSQPASVSTAASPSRVSLRARETIEIGCGESSIVLKSDGTVIIRGRRVTSRAKESNKMKGGSVSIN